MSNVHHEVKKYLRKATDCNTESPMNDATMCLDTIFPDTTVWEFEFTQNHLKLKQNAKSKENEHTYKIGPFSDNKAFQGNIVIRFLYKTRTVVNLDC